MVTYTATLAYYFLRESSTSFSHFKVSKMVWTHGIEKPHSSHFESGFRLLYGYDSVVPVNMTDGSNLADALTGNVYRV